MSTDVRGQLKQLLAKVVPPCVGAKLPPSNNRVPLLEHVYVPWFHGASLGRTRAGALIFCLCRACDHRIKMTIHLLSPLL